MTTPAQQAGQPPRIGGAGSTSGSLINIWNIGVDRLVGIMPLSISQEPVLDVNLQPVPGKFKDRIVADVIVLEGPPIEFGGRYDRSTPHHSSVQVPHLVQGMWVEQFKIVQQIREYLPLPGNPGTGGIAVGRFKRGQAQGQNSAPWLLSTPPGPNAMPAERSQWDADLARVGQWWQSYAAGQFVNTTPGPIGVYPGQYPQSAPHYPQQQGPQQQPQYQQPQQQPQYQQPQYPTQQQTSYPPMPAAQPTYQGQPAAGPDPWAYQPPQQQQAPQQPAYAPPSPPPAVPLPALGPDGTPAGWDPAVWHSLPEAQRHGILAQMGLGAAASANVPPF